MSEKFVSTISADGYFMAPAVADESPLEPGLYLLPAGAVDLPPPNVPAGYRAKLEAGAFVLEAIPEAPAPTPEQIAEAVRLKRAAAYQNEADPLYFKAQRGEATLDEWKAKVEEIKTRFPDGIMPA